MENKEIKVSVVIPVYNTEKYVREAVESIMNQTLRKLEIIIINDGSTDNSLQVAEELAAADSRIQVYSQTNRGLSMARNAGITHAHGRYIYFMDSDDLLEKDAMELCYSKCEEKELDKIVMVGDRSYDILGGHAEGLKVIGVLYGYGSREELEKAGATKIAKSVEDLKNILLNWK